PKSVRVGDSPTAVVKVTNLGTETWKSLVSAAQVRLGAGSGCPSSSSANEWTWLPGTLGYAKSPVDARIFLSRASVAPGESTTFSVKLAPGGVAGDQRRFSARMVAEGVAWFGNTASGLVQLTSPPADAGTDA